MNASVLEQSGLTPEESDIYLSLIENGKQTAGKLATTTKVQRTYVYRIVQDLITKNLVSEETDKGKKVFSPLSPDNLIAQAEEQKTKAIQAERALEEALPGLKIKYLTSGEKPIISYHEGVEGLKKIYEDTIKEGKEIFAVLQTSDVDPQMHEWLAKTYVKQRIKSRIWANVIVASGSWSETYRSLDEAEFRKTILVPGDLFPFKHEINIYGSKVAFMNYKKGEKLLGFIIDHPQIATTMKGWFDLGWYGAEAMKNQARK